MEVVPCVCLHPLEPSAQSGCRWCNLHGSRQLCPRALHLFNRWVPLRPSHYFVVIIGPPSDCSIATSITCKHVSDLEGEKSSVWRKNEWLANFGSAKSEKWTAVKTSFTAINVLTLLLMRTLFVSYHKVIVVCFFVVFFYWANYRLIH